ncbi:MAG TPA: hypothetical protein VF841_05880 [Anaeromyxobacter sp.]
MDATAAVELKRLFWIVLAGLAVVLAAVVLLVRSGRTVPGPMPGGAAGAGRPRRAARSPRA